MFCLFVCSKIVLPTHRVTGNRSCEKYVLPLRHGRLFFVGKRIFESAKNRAVLFCFTATANFTYKLYSYGRAVACHRRFATLCISDTHGIRTIAIKPKFTEKRIVYYTEKRPLVCLLFLQTDCGLLIFCI